MELLREVVESFIRLIKSEIHPNAVLVSSDDMFEVTMSPSVVLQGPTVTENGDRRSQAKSVAIDLEDLTYEQRNQPRLYHLDFDMVVTTATQGELLDLMEKTARFYQINPVLTVAEHGSLYITELVPLGGLRRVNLSNLRQASGRCRIEDCPVYDDRITTGPLVAEVLLDMNV
ncbi:MAG: hypothetical protein ACYC27_16060 [Armatimonadota bacterium]